MESEATLKILIILFKAVMAGATAFFTLKGLIHAFFCGERKPFKEFLITFKWLLVAILFNLIIIR